VQRQPVSSSNLKSVGYDRVTQTLEIEFQSGAVYEYYNVPVGVYAGLMQASSHGQYFHQNIRNRYRYRRVKK